MTELVGAALLFAAVAFLLKNLGWRGAPVLVAVCSVYLISSVAEELGSVFRTVSVLTDTLGAGEAVSAAIKVIGLGYLFGICADICRELEAAGIAKAVEVVGRVEIIAVVLPYFKEIIETGIGFIE